MSTCAENKKALELFAAGLEIPTAFDHDHAARCRDCALALEEARHLKALLEGYEREAEARGGATYSEARLAAAVKTAWNPPSRTKPWAAKWLAAAAALLLAVGISYVSYEAGRKTALESNYITALKHEAVRAELHSYLSKSRIFLLSLVDGTHDCSEGVQVEKAVARKLIYQKRLLEPELESPAFQDLRPLVDEIGLFLTEVANTEGCLHQEEVELWQEVLRSRATLLKLNLLQMKDRI